jgi:hypothetical protein
MGGACYTHERDEKCMHLFGEDEGRFQIERNGHGYEDDIKMHTK